MSAGSRTKVCGHDPTTMIPRLWSHSRGEIPRMRNKRDQINLGLQTGIYSREKLKPQREKRNTEEYREILKY